MSDLDQAEQEAPFPQDGVWGRVTMAVIGGAAGLALYLFVDVLAERIENSRLLLFVAALVMGGFAIQLALSGPLRTLRAMAGALAVALPAALLLLWASMRFDAVASYLEAGHALVAFAAILFVATPFAAAGLQAPGGWRDYARLFDLSWTIVVRYAAGWLFVGLFWAVLLLSNELLQLVGIGLIERLLRVDPVPYVLSGVVLGLALAVVYELRDYVSPFLIHRLLRLLLPMLLPVVAVFVVALPLNGFAGMFGGLSASATLMAVAAAGITLISTALDRGDAEAATSPVMVWSAKAFALALPVLAGLAVFGIWLRVSQYGWTPVRLMAGLAGLFLLVYGIAYAASVLRGGAGWMRRVRSANRWMALAVVAVAGLWLTPLLNAERIAAESQLTRALAAFDAPEPPAPDGFALWEMAHDWGRPGTEALAELEAAALAWGAEPVMAAIARAREARSRYAFERGAREGDWAARVAELAGLMQVRPEGALPEAAFDALPGRTVDLWLEACRNRLGDGRPGCVVLLGDFRPGLGVPNGYVLLNRKGLYLQISGIALRDGKLKLHGSARTAASLAKARKEVPKLTRENLAAVLDGYYTIAPVEIRALQLGGLDIIPDN